MILKSAGLAATAAYALCIQAQSQERVTGFLSQPESARAIAGHVDQGDIARGAWSAEQLKTAGRRLFLAQFTKLDGVGRPGATGDENPTRRPLVNARAFTRSAGPDSNSCYSCHRSPGVGGAGDFSVNAFIGPGSREPAIDSISPHFAAERNTPEMNGAGAIELLAREMTADMHALRMKAIATAKSEGQSIRVELLTKGVSFGHITSLPNGEVAVNEVEGVDTDLVVRPWGQKGNVTSLRTFTVTAANLHHGIQPRERFGVLITGTSYHDRDGVADELTEGDVTALTVFQAMLSVPGKFMPAEAGQRALVARGETVFKEVGCAECHIPALRLRSPIYTEPGPYNLEGTLKSSEVERPVAMDLTVDGTAPRLAPDSEGEIWIAAFTDLKRHRISDSEKRHFGNEVTVQGFVPTETFITRRLWAAGNTGPYGHRGDLTTIEEAILHHGGEATESRRQFEDLSGSDQEAIVAFLRSMQVLPDGSPSIVHQKPAAKLPYMGGDQ